MALSPLPAPATVAPHLWRRGVAPLPDGGWLRYVRSVGPKGAPPLLVLPPPGGVRALGEPLLAGLSAARPVVTYDPRGAGGSSAAPFGQRARAMAQDARQLLDDLGVARADLLGVGLGAGVAEWLARDAPERVGRLVLAPLPRPAWARLVAALWPFDRLRRPPAPRLVLDGNEAADAPALAARVLAFLAAA
jgi:pimeloyl-ACP methyl ester carboxylesterase